MDFLLLTKVKNITDDLVIYSGKLHVAFYIEISLIRFIFRPVSSKFSGSTESLKIPLKLEKNVPESMVKIDTKAETKEKNKANKKAENAKKNSQVKKEFY